jgi:hypothetical protein
MPWRQIEVTMATSIIALKQVEKYGSCAGITGRAHMDLPGEEVFNGKAGKAGLTILLGRALYDY